MRTLTEVFTPGAPTLPEGLRTLVVSPERELEPGMTVRASFTFRNQGGAPATGVRVRLNVPEGLVYLVGTGQLDGNDLDDEQGNCPLLARNGAHIGDVGPGEERRIEIAYSVAGAIENGSSVELQAAVSAFEIAPVGSNVVRLVVRSNPVLENALTNCAIEARHDARAGAEATVTVRVHNAGESSAHDVVVVAPIPDHASYIPNSARVNGREIEPDLRAPFDRVYAPIIARTLPASATVTLTYRIRIDDPLEDGTAIVSYATIASQETQAFAIAPASITIASSARFDDDQTSLSVEPAGEVEPGSRVTMRLRICNGGTAAAQNVRVTLTLPDGLLLVRGATRLDGRALREKKKEQGVFELGRVDARATVELAIDCIVASPIANGTVLTPSLSLEWETGARPFERALTVRSAPYLSPRRNTIERASASVVRPGDEIEALITLTNDGSASASDAVLEVHVDPGLDDVSVLEKNTRLTLEESSVEIDHLEAYTSRKFVVRARVRSPYQDRADLVLSASLHSLELGETALGTVTYRVDSHPAFTPERSTIGLLSDDVLRPNQSADVFVRLVNEGTDVANDVRLRLYISPEARLESVDGASREKSSLVFGEIPPGGTAEARLGLRLMRSLAREYPVTIDAVLTAGSLLPVPLGRLTIVTTAEPDFSVGAMRSEPIDVVDVGETVEYVLHVRNGGDGPARRVQITVDRTDTLIYVPNSTTVNDVPVRDVGALSPVLSERGIVLNDVDPGVEAVVRWRDVVHNGLAAGESIVRVARIRYDGDRTDELISAELKVRSAPSFSNNIPGLPFGLDGMIGPSLGGSQRALPGADEKYLELPPPTPVNGHYPETAPIEIAAPQYLPLETTAPVHNGQHTQPAFEPEPGVATYSAFAPGELEKIARFLDEARFGGIVSHLFAMRAFLPTQIAGGRGMDVVLRAAREQVRDVLDRLFIKLRLPQYVLADRDVQTPGLREAAVRLMHELQTASGELHPPAQAQVLRGSVPPATVASFADMADDAPIARVWHALSSIIVDGTPALRAYRVQLTQTFSHYRAEPEQVFLDALRREETPELDAALVAVKSELVSPV